MPKSSPAIPVADWAAPLHRYPHIEDVFLDERDQCSLGGLPVLPDDAAVSGWHSLLSMTYAVEEWFWDAVILAWREWPRGFIAETAQALGCEGYAYLASIAPPF